MCLPYYLKVGSSNLGGLISSRTISLLRKNGKALVLLGPEKFIKFDIFYWELERNGTMFCVLELSGGLQNIPFTSQL